MEKTVLLVDDDRVPMKYYVSALVLTGFRVKHFLGPDSALAFVRKKGLEIHAIVMDIMMPPGKEYENRDTKQGLITGVFLLEDLRQYCPDLPVVVLTNVKNPETLAKLNDKDMVKVRDKFDYPPFELASEVADMVGK